VSPKADYVAHFATWVIACRAGTGYCPAVQKNYMLSYAVELYNYHVAAVGAVIDIF
jgi:hypothetical protein